jgi:hypothetical protein
MRDEAGPAFVFVAFSDSPSDSARLENALAASPLPWRGGAAMLPAMPARAPIR